MLNRIEIIGGAILVVLITISEIYYGHYRYNQGFNAATVQAVIQQHKIEADYNKKLSSLNERIVATDKARRTASNNLNSVLADIDRMRREASHHTATKTSTAKSTHDAGAIWRKRFGQCSHDYAGMAKRAAGYADQINGLQDYVKEMK